MKSATMKKEVAIYFTQFNIVYLQGGGDGRLEYEFNEGGGEVGYTLHLHLTTMKSATMGNEVAIYVTQFNMFHL